MKNQAFEPVTLCASELGFHATHGTADTKAILDELVKLGITHYKCMPDRFGDCIWLFNCRNLPSQLPNWLYRESCTAIDWVGKRGAMTKEIADDIVREAHVELASLQ